MICNLEFLKISFHQLIDTGAKIVKLFHQNFEQYENKDTMCMRQEWHFLDECHELS